jgi:uncharacterized FlaG/YvyC family protein
VRRPEVKAAAAEADPAAERSESEESNTFEVRGTLPELPGRELSIRREKDLNQVIVQVLDSETKEVVRQYPPEEVLSVLRQLQKTGVLLDKKG